MNDVKVFGDLLNTAFLDPIQPYLEIDRIQQDTIWEQSQQFSKPRNCWQGYINRLCLETILPWLKDYDSQTHTAINSALLPSIWEFVTGTPIIFGQHRLILLPTEDISVDDMTIPQEWMDTRDWVGIWYLMAQINLDEGWVRLIGFATHESIKRLGNYHWQDRTYNLPEVYWTRDWNILWLSQSITATDTLQSPVSALSLPSIDQAHSLIQRLGNSDIVIPRLAIPFIQWGALISHDGWRQQLAARRWDLPEQWSIRQWLQSGISQLSQQLGWQVYDLEASLSNARGEEQNAIKVISRTLELAGQTYELQISPMATEQTNTWRFELKNISGDGQIPPGFTLRLLTEDLQPFADNEDSATEAVESLYIEVSLLPGEGIVWETVPLPEVYQQEILRF
ncbi:DUF1822 family protein [Leptolyngbya cf. ectocarpi LEGE 11479]|uniref:DUF1822 family protein n=2 Tax=Leptolyngbya ectocarpi TaxID=1202 RepID=A0A929F9H5_LEPEC|nr:DUF1822 family protein [Leptolyngbya cf. ectocarpi LEGE 11479]